jgi:predicted permease
MTRIILQLWSRLRGFFGEERSNREFREEIETHIALLTETYTRNGMSEQDAMYAARRQFGNAALLEQHQREARALLWPSTLFQDVHYALRILAKSPATTAIAIISLALGIGANTTIFTVAKAALFDALSVRHPEQLRLLAYAQDERSAIRGGTWGDFYVDPQGRTVLASFSCPVYQELQRDNHSLGDLFAFVDLTQFEHLSATIDGHAEVVTAELVSGNFFRGMDVGTILGRTIEPADDAASASGTVAVISYSFWQRRFDRSPSIVGKTINVNLTAITIVGVAPKGFSGASHVHTPQDLFMPLSAQPLIFPWKAVSLLSDPNTWWIQIMGRLSPGTSETEARASLAVNLNQAVRSTMAVPQDRTVPPLLLLPGGRGWNYASQQLEHPMPLLLALAGLVLLLACVNVANLLLAGSSSRSREISIRLALGAGRARVVRQLLTESLCLSALGGSAGLLLGYLSRNILPRLLSSSWGPVVLRARFDWQVFGFTLFIAVLSGLGFGAVPAWEATRISTNAGLKDGGTTVTRHRRGLTGKMLATAQVALSMLLLVSSGLFVRTLANLNAVNPGFNKKGLLLFAIEPPAKRYPSPKNVEVLHQIEGRIGSLPGVESVSLSREALLAQSGSNSDFISDDQAKIPAHQGEIAFNSVGRDFFPTMGIPMLYGRAFDSSDTSTSTSVAVINRALAQMEFGGRSPIAAFFRMKQGGEPLEIVGVCADAKYAWIRDKEPPTFYVLYTQQKDLKGSMTFEVRTKGNPESLSDEVRRAVEGVDKDLPLIDLRTQEEQVDAALAPERSFAIVTSGFGILALMLASVGVYGVVAASVSRRVNEIGVRMALGARADQVLRMVLGEAVGLALLGIGVGLSAALFLTRFLTSMLFGLKPADPPTLLCSGLLLSLVAVVAAWGPAQRASHIEPVRALRHE